MSLPAGGSGPRGAAEAWRAGLEIFPGSKEFLERTRMRSDSEVLALVEIERSLERKIDTDLSFLDREL